MYMAFLGSTYDVSEAADGLAALEAIEDQLPDLVITDLSLPRMDGFEFIARLRAVDRTAALPIIALSGHAGPETEARALAAGTTLVLLKPCPPDSLLDAIGRLLEPRVSGEKTP